MSNTFTRACRALILPPTQKAVLMALADYCHDETGKDWHSVASICEWTCLGRTAVIDALKGLETRGLIVVDRTKGRGNVTWLQIDRIQAAQDQSAKRTSAPAGPVRQTDHPSPPNGPPRVRHADEPVRQPDPKHQEASVEAAEKHQGKSARTRAASPQVLCPDDVDAQVWADWLQLRKAKQAPVTLTVVSGAQREADKAGMTLEAFLRIWCCRGSQGLLASWLTDYERGPTGPAGGRPINGQQVINEVSPRIAPRWGPAGQRKAEKLMAGNIAAVERFLEGIN